MKLWVLEDSGGRCNGVLTSYQLAMEYVYWGAIYQTYRGYRSDIDKIIWVENEMGWQWQGRKESDYKQPLRTRPPATWTIYLRDVDQPHVDQPRLAAWANNYPSQSEVFRMITYAEEVAEHKHGIDGEVD